MVTDSSNLLFSENINSVLTTCLEGESFSKLFILVDENTDALCLPLISSGLPKDYHLIRIKSGEANKTIETCQLIWGSLTEANADRQSLIINLGGGVICDMGGFCARTYKRGIKFWNVPTTLLSQVDASVGGKLGVDFGDFKNQIGLFSDPDLVVMDTIFFKTLPEDEILSGFAEIVKHALIKDKDMFAALIELDFQEIVWQKWVKRSVGLKQEIVDQDPTEKGLRKILNFGHTIGHAIESYLLNTENSLKHGEAVAIGMIAETHLSYIKDMLSKEEGEQIIKYILAVFPQQKIESDAIDTIVKLSLQDKKNDNNRIKAVLLNSIGSASYDIEISENEIRQSLEHYNNLVR